jgi:hypothetical protein
MIACSINEEIVKFVQIFENLKGSENIGYFGTNGEIIKNSANSLEQSPSSEDKLLNL